MHRRSTAERLDNARGDGTIARLTGEHPSKETSETWVAAYEAHGPRVRLDGSAAYGARARTGSAERPYGGAPRTSSRD